MSLAVMSWAVMVLAVVTIDVLLSEVSSVFIPEDYSRQRTRMAKSRMGEEEA